MARLPFFPNLKISVATLISHLVDLNACVHFILTKSKKSNYNIIYHLFI